MKLVGTYKMLCIKTIRVLNINENRFQLLVHFKFTVIPRPNENDRSRSPYKLEGVWKLERVDALIGVNASTRSSFQTKCTRRDVRLFLETIILIRTRSNSRLEIHDIYFRYLFKTIVYLITTAYFLINKLFTRK